MGDLRPDNGGGWPPEDGGSPRDDLPELPPEWGTVVIPDDPSELAAEADAVRRQLRRVERGRALRRAIGLPPATVRSTEETPGVGIPLIIMGVAILTTLISLFVVTWDHRPAAPQPTAAVDTALSDLAFNDSTGQAVRLGTLLPAVVLLIDECECINLVIDTARAAPGVAIVPVARTVPIVPGAPGNVRALADPNGFLHLRYARDVSRPSNAAVALLVDRDGKILRTLPAVRGLADLTEHLTLITG
jgi:hypothetical protein